MTTHTPCDREHDFVLILSGVAELTTEVENALFEAGCDDATLSVQYGRLCLEFSRTAPSLMDAVLSAIRDVRRAGQDVLRVDECDLVTQADIARRTDRSRQVISQYVAGVRGPGGFPPPACHIVDGAPLWQWCAVSFWLWQNGMIKPEELREAEVIAAVNNVLELWHQRKRIPGLVEDVERTVSVP